MNKKTKDEKREQIAKAILKKEFNQIKNKLIREFGRDAMYEDEVTEVARRYLGNKYLGTFPVDKVPIKPGSMIVNVDKHYQPGSHWASVYITTRTIYVYDSFARKSKKLLKMLHDKGKKLGYKVVDVNEKADQKGGSMVCGMISLAWLVMVDKYGIRTASKI